VIALWLLLFVPVAPLLHYGMVAGPIWVFLSGAVAVGVLAEWIRRATEQLAARTGSAIGGLLTVSFGSIAELVLALFVLLGGATTVVQAQITGSIIGTSLLGLGLAIVAGGLGRERQSFKRERAGLLSSMLILVVIALLLPAVFNYTGGHVVATRDLAVTDESLSLGVSAVLLALYGANLIYTLVTHRDVFAPGDKESGEEGDGEASWSTARALAVLVAATVAVALESELISDALMETAGALHLTPLFLGIVVLALVGTASDLFAAAYFARQDRMGLVMSICIGSAIQMALVVAPLLVILSWLLGYPMTLVFGNPLDLFAIAGTAFIVNAITADGETTWFEGVLLIGIYVLIALAFFFVGTAA
jgi:Ca2+:H+ antiporter